MHIVKALHVIFIFVWVGNLLTLTRLMGYHIKEDVDTQMRLAKLYRRMYFFVGLPTMSAAILFGISLLPQLNLSYNPLWFYLKMLGFGMLLLCDIACGRSVMRLNREPDLGRGVKYKILHGVAGLMLILIIFNIYAVRDKNGEQLALESRLNHETREKFTEGF